MPNPTLVSAQVLSDGRVAYTFSEDIDPTGIDVTAFHVAQPDPGDPVQVGDSVDDVADEVVTLNMTNGPLGYTSENGATTMISRNGLRAQVGGLPALPFVNRRCNPFLKSATEIDGQPDELTLVWSEAVTVDAVGNLKWTLDGIHYHGTAVSSGNGTSTWHVTGNTSSNSVPEGKLTAESAVAHDADDAPTSEGTVLIVPT